MALNVLAYNMKRVMAIIGVAALLEGLGCLSRGLAYSKWTPTEAPGSVTGGSQNSGSQENCVRRANASRVLRAVPIRGLSHTAWAKSDISRRRKTASLSPSDYREVHRRAGV